jgi:hypothetical protein
MDYRNHEKIIGADLCKGDFGNFFQYCRRLSKERFSEYGGHFVDGNKNLRERFF